MVKSRPICNQLQITSRDLILKQAVFLHDFGIMKNIGLTLSLSLLLMTPAWATLCRDSIADGSVQEIRTPRLIVISGTNRAGSSTLKVSQQVVEIAQTQGLKVDLLDISQVSPGTYNKDGYWNTSKSFQKNYDAKINEADAVLIVFPEYNGSYPGILKTFLDYSQASFNGKLMALVGISDGQWGSIRGAEDLRTTLNHRKAEILGQSQVLIPGVNKLLDGGTRLQDPSLLSRLENAVRDLIAPIKKQEKDQSQLLKLALKSQEAMDFTFNSGVTVRSKLTEVLRDNTGQIIFMKWSGKTEMRAQNQVLDGQGHSRHPEGFSTPVGPILREGLKKNLSSAKSLEDLTALGINLDPNIETTLKFASGVVVKGKFASAQFAKNGGLQVLTLEQTTSKYGTRVLYQKDWGPFDMLVGEKLETLSTLE